MEPHIDNTFYSWIIIGTIVFVATLVGAAIDKFRALRVRRQRVAVSREKRVKNIRTL